MKSKLLLLLLLANFSFYAQTNLVTNGDFENWTAYSQPNDWERYFNGLLYQDSDAQNGNSSAKVEITSGTFNYFYTNINFPVEIGKTYRVTAYHKLASGSFTSIELNLIASDGYQTKIAGTIDNITSNSQWRKIEFDYVATANRNIGVMIWAKGTTSSQILVDNVSVVNVPPTTPQYTSIPDSNFEQSLIDQGIDTDGLNGKVLTSNINTLTYLNVNNRSIQDLTGIQDFVNLETLTCNKNNLTALDLSSNTKLTYINARNNNLATLNITNNTLLTDLTCDSNKLTTLNIDNNAVLEDLRCGTNLLTSLNVSKNPRLLYLICHENQIGSLDVSQNIALEWLMFHYNKVKTIDISKNPNLTYFDCLFNELTSIDISKNPKIFEVACQNNQLTYLNLKNGNNLNFDLNYSDFRNNPNLTCIEVDNVAYSEANWSALKDSNASYSSSCTLGVEDSAFEKAAIYPNPTKGELNISNITLEKATVYNSLGQLVKSFTLNNANTDNTINLSGLPKGVYYVYLINGDAASAKKVIVE